jgi:nicotinate-nucleotide adenylyltransferase
VRVAIYGGSFNPPHVGHAMIAAWIRWTARADEVWLVPTFRHAFEKRLAPWEDRVEMARRLATALGDWCRVETVEAELPVPSYTVRTLEVLAGRNPHAQLALVVGADVAEQLGAWKDVDRLLARFPLIRVGREGYPPVPDAPTFPDLSSTEVRNRVAGRLPVGHLVPEKVLEWIEARGLYG